MKDQVLLRKKWARTESNLSGKTTFKNGIDTLLRTHTAYSRFHAHSFVTLHDPATHVVPLLTKHPPKKEKKGSLVHQKKSLLCNVKTILPGTVAALDQFMCFLCGFEQGHGATDDGINSTIHNQIKTVGKIFLEPIQMCRADIGNGMRFHRFVF